jgi:hypothetical protein
MMEAEAVIELASGCEVRCPPGSEDCEYVRIVNADGCELAYWHYTEFQEDPVLVLGALLGAMQSSEADEEPDPGRCDCEKCSG